MTSITSTHFFKFIKPGSKYNLSIPRSCWTNLNETRCNNALLKRGRHEWPVDISDEGVFRDGWKEFVRDNGVEEFDFITFKHQGNYVFDFMVFDQSMCERQYPSNLVDEMDVEEPLKESDSVHSSEKSKVLKGQKRKRTSSKNEDKLALDDDRCFTAIMTPYSIKSYRLQVPASFVRSNGLLNGTRRTRVVLMDEARRTCQATLAIHGSSQLRLVGLREFIIKKDLKVEDECTFELIKHGKVPVFNVVIRTKKSIENNMLVKKKRKTISTIKKETQTTINNDYRSFISTLKPSSLTKSGLYVPTEFSIQNGLKLGELVLKDDKGRLWKAQLNKKGEKAFYVGSKGLKDLCNANGLKEGDTFKFELVKNQKDKPHVAKISRYVNANSTPPEKENHPYFIGEVKDYFIKQSRLHLPSKFTKTSGLIDKEEMILKIIKDEKSLTVKLKSDTKKTYTYLSGQGWKDFCSANDLKEGDLFKLELVSNGEKPVANFYFLKVC